MTKETVMPGGFLPYTDSGLLSFSANFSALISADPQAYGVSVEAAESYAGLQAAYAAALAKCEPGVRCQSAVIGKNAARAALKAASKRLSYVVSGTASVTVAQRAELQLNVRAKPTSAPVPAAAPGISVLGVRGWTVSIRLFDTSVGGNRGKARDAYGASLFSFAGDVAPTDISLWKFEGHTGKVKNDLEFSSTLARGTTVWLTAFWFNYRKQHGPLSSPVSTIVVGGGVAKAA